MKNVKLVVFDMDGLILDTERLNLNAWLEIGKEYNYPITKDIIGKIVGIRRVDHPNIIKKYLGSDFPYEEIYNLKTKRVNNIICEEGVEVKAGLLDLLDFLDSKGILKAVATSTSRPRAEELLKKVNIFHRFDTIICGDEVTLGKPHPEIFLTACKKCGIHRDNTLVLEDSENGLLAAHEGNLRCIVVPDLIYPRVEYRTFPTKIVSSLLDVIPYIQSTLEI